MSNLIVDWEIEKLQQVPKYRKCLERHSDGVEAILIEGLPYQGKKSEIFAWIGFPKNASIASKVPAVVLVHGGGGTAFPSWVKFWNNLGYAAIAMDNCGGMPPQSELDGRFKDGWERHENSGPAGWGVWQSSILERKEQWMYHAVSSVILSHSLLRSFDVVDCSKIGITGVSWGGVITSTAASLDSRFAAAAPIYGCGNLDIPNGLVDASSVDSKLLQKWFELWDPKNYLPLAKIPFLWVNGTNDFAFPPKATMKSAEAKSGDNYFSIQVRMDHCHGPISEETPEVVRFFDWLLKNNPPSFSKLQITSVDNMAICDLATLDNIGKIELIYTRATAYSADCTWNNLELPLSELQSQKISCKVPYATKAFYFNITSTNGLIFSTKIIFR